MNMLKTEAPKGLWCDYTPRLFPGQRRLDRLPQFQHRRVPPEDGSQPDVVPLQRAVSDHPDADGVGPHVSFWPESHRQHPQPARYHAGWAATKVYNFLNTQATNVASYATSPLWSVVDGPWKLQSFTTTGEVTFVPNPDYSGSPKPILSKFVEVPFTSDEAILNEIKSGGPNAPSMAELPDEYLPQVKSIASEGYNPVNFTDYGISYFPLNLGNPTFGPVFSQLYFRQAMQHLVDADGWLQKILGGYAVPTYGPVPTAPSQRLCRQL